MSHTMNCAQCNTLVRVTAPGAADTLCAECASNINDTVTMLVQECDAIPSTALAIAQRSEYTLEGRSILDAQGNEVAFLQAPEYKRGGLGPHGVDVLAKLVVKLLNEHYRHTGGK